MKIIETPAFAPDDLLKNPPVEVSDGAFMFLPGAGVFRFDVGGNPYVVKIHLTSTPSGVRPDAVLVEAPDGSPPVTSAVLHAVAVGELVQETVRLAFRGWSRRTDDGGEETVLYALTEGEAELVRLRGPVESSLREAAKIYNFAAKAGLGPVQEVMRQIGLQRPTATRWIRKARAAGFITEEGK